MSELVPRKPEPKLVEGVVLPRTYTIREAIDAFIEWCPKEELDRRVSGSKLRIHIEEQEDGRFQNHVQRDIEAKVEESEHCGPFDYIFRNAYFDPMTGTWTFR